MCTSGPHIDPADSPPIAGEHPSRARLARRYGRCLAVALAAWLSANPLQATEVVICTERGRAIVELADAESPLHVANFLRYVDSGYYSGTVFHRVVRSFVVQGGGVDRRLRTRPTLPPVVSEAGNGLNNVRGTIAAARSQDPNSASAQFFVNIEDNAALDPGRDPGYTVFGRVKEGIAVFDEISRLPTEGRGPFRADVPTPLVAIQSIVRHDEPALAALPLDGREAFLKAEIGAAAAAGNHAEALRRIGHYRALCAGQDSEIALTEARSALAVGERQRAAFVLEELLAMTPATDANHAAATALYVEALRVVADCRPAVPPELPDATAASRDDMLAAREQMRAFVASGDGYLACLATVIDDEDQSAEDRNVAVTEHNRVVDVLKETAASFNEQLRVFRTRP